MIEKNLQDTVGYYLFVKMPQMIKVYQTKESKKASQDLILEIYYTYIALSPFLSEGTITQVDTNIEWRLKGKWAGKGHVRQWLTWVLKPVMRDKQLKDWLTKYTATTEVVTEEE